jgi:hypothetical protein
MNKVKKCLFRESVHATVKVYTPLLNKTQKFQYLAHEDNIKFSVVKYILENSAVHVCKHD